jgi:hypothetical protein
MPDNPSLPEQAPHPPAVTSTPGGRFSLVVTNVAKLAGLIGGIHECVGPARYSAVLFWAALFMGAQAVEDTIARIIDRTMGK